MITQNELKEILLYSPETGIFTWKKRLSIRIVIGKIAGCVRIKKKQKIICIGINSVSYKAHRLAFLYMTGEMPEFVDHKDRDGTNNKWHNLRTASKAQNSVNVSLKSNNTSGFKGVHLRKDNKTNPWRATIKVEGKDIQIGYFNTAELAARAYDTAAIKYFGEYSKLNFEDSCEA